MSNQRIFLGYGASAAVIKQKQKETVQKLFFNQMEHREVENINYIKEKIKPYPKFLIDYQIENDLEIQYGKKLVMPYLSREKGWEIGILDDYDIYKKIRNALIKLHNIGFYHNDIKRENIFINTKTNEIKLIDFDYSLNDDIIDKVYNKNDKKEIRDFNILSINLFPCFCDEVKTEYNNFKYDEDFYIEKETFKKLLKLNDLYSLDKNLFYVSGEQYKERFENQMKKEKKKMDRGLSIVFPTMLEILKKTPDYDTFVKTDKKGKLQFNKFLNKNEFINQNNNRNFIALYLKNPHIIGKATFFKNNFYDDENQNITRKIIYIDTLENPNFFLQKDFELNYINEPKGNLLQENISNYSRLEKNFQDISLIPNKIMDLNKLIVFECSGENHVGIPLFFFNGNTRSYHIEKNEINSYCLVVSPFVYTNENKKKTIKMYYIKPSDYHGVSDIRLVPIDKLKSIQNYLNANLKTNNDSPIKINLNTKFELFPQGHDFQLRLIQPYEYRIFKINYLCIGFLNLLYTFQFLAEHENNAFLEKDVKNLVDAKSLCNNFVYSPLITIPSIQHFNELHELYFVIIDSKDMKITV